MRGIEYEEKVIPPDGYAMVNVTLKSPEIPKTINPTVKPTYETFSLIDKTKNVKNFYAEWR